MTMRHHRCRDVILPQLGALGVQSFKEIGEIDISVA